LPFLPLPFFEHPIVGRMKMNISSAEMPNKSSHNRLSEAVRNEEEYDAFKPPFGYDMFLFITT
jgi:hypothetical protein